MLDLVQGSPEWLAARAGKIGASQIADAMATVKTGEAAARKNLRAQLVCERLTGKPTDTFCSPAMQRGKDLEPHARAAYSLASGIEVVETGIVPHPTIADAQCSPDGLVDFDGLVELKCCGSARHIEVLTGSPPEDRYVKQVYWQMACTGAQWADLAYFNPDFPEPMQLKTFRFERDDQLIGEIEQAVTAFLAEIDATVAELRERYMEKEAA